MNNYIKPNISIVRISNQQIMAASGPEKADVEFDDGLSKSTGGMLWDEDEDDDPMGAPSFDIWEE